MYNYNSLPEGDTCLKTVLSTSTDILNIFGIVFGGFALTVVFFLCSV